MNYEFLSILPSAVVLGAAAVIALYLTLTRGWADESRTHIRGAVQIVLVTILFHPAHFVEELSAGLHERLPALFGLPPMPLRFFVSFNVAWLVIWSLSSWGLESRVAKMEVGDPSVTLDLLIRTLVKSGTPLEEVGRILSKAKPQSAAI